MSELRSWFLRNVLEALERQLGPSVIASLRAKLPPRLSPHASLEVLRASGALDTVPLDEGEELLLSLDSLLGDGSGKLLQSVGVDLVSRVLSQPGTIARSGDLAGTVVRLQAFLEHPFVDVPITFEVRRNRTGFALTVGVRGHSRATRALAHVTIGAVVAAERFAREVGAELLKISSDNIADRSIIRADYLPVEEQVPEQAPPRSRRRAATRLPSASLSAEVERILGSSPPARASSNSTRPDLRGSHSMWPYSDPATRPANESNLATKVDAPAPESSTQRVATVAAPSASAARRPAAK